MTCSPSCVKAAPLFSFVLMQWWRQDKTQFKLSQRHSNNNKYHTYVSVATCFCSFSNSGNGSVLQHAMVWTKVPLSIAQTWTAFPPKESDTRRGKSFYNYMILFPYLYTWSSRFTSRRQEICHWQRGRCNELLPLDQIFDMYVDILASLYPISWWPPLLLCIWNKDPVKKGSTSQGRSMEGRYGFTFLGFSVIGVGRYEVLGIIGKLYHGNLVIILCMGKIGKCRQQQVRSRWGSVIRRERRAIKEDRWQTCGVMDVSIVLTASCSAMPRTLKRKVRSALSGWLW